jgi:hypothetical protein
MKKGNQSDTRLGDEEEIRLQLPMPNLKALLDPTNLTPEEAFDRLPLAWKEFREGGVKEVPEVWEDRFGGPPVLVVVSEKIPFSVALGHMRAQQAEGRNAARRRARRLKRAFVFSPRPRW